MPDWKNNLKLFGYKAVDQNYRFTVLVYKSDESGGGLIVTS